MSIPRFLALSLALAALFPGTAQAIPEFARRYELPCHFCHDGYPKLSALGEQFKERGYRLDDDKTGVSDWWRSIPASFRGTFRQTFEEEGEADATGRFRFVSGGALGSRVSYWIDESYFVDEGGFDRSGTDNAFLRVELLPDELYLRGGRMELDLPFTQARTPQLYAYDIYFATTGFETDNIGSHQDGVEAGGFLDDATRWSIAVVRGQDSEEERELSDSAGRFDANVFGRLTRRFGEDRAGFYFYWGRNTLARANPDPASGGPAVLEWEDDLLRLGADGSAYLENVHLYGTFLYGRNSNSFADAQNPAGTEQTASFAGGFAQVDYSLRDEVAISGRFDWVHGPAPGTVAPSKTFFGFSPGLKLWLHPRIRLAFELSFRNQDRPTRGAIQVDLAL
jgi:hypothetical protein